jgi:hypothetical protein
MDGRRMLIGAAIAAVLALGTTGMAGAHWYSDWDDHGMTGPGMMDPIMMDPEVMGPGMMGPGMTLHHPDWWDD